MGTAVALAWPPLSLNLQGPERLVRGGGLSRVGFFTSGVTLGDVRDIGDLGRDIDLLGRGRAGREVKDGREGRG